MEDNSSNAPATQRDLDAMEARLAGRLEHVIEATHGRLEQVIETMRDIETNMLTEFHRYARG